MVSRRGVAAVKKGGYAKPGELYSRLGPKARVSRGEERRQEVKGKVVFWSWGARRPRTEAGRPRTEAGRG